jgi:hypothetical protein
MNAMDTKIYVVRAARASYPTSMGELNCIAQACLAYVSLSLFFDLCEVAHVPAFYNSRSSSYNGSRDPTGGLGVGQTLCYRAHRLGVANDVFNGVGMPSLISSPYCTEYDQRRGAVQSGRITTVAMSWSGQLGRRCTFESNCSGMSTRLAGASVTREHALETYEPSYVPGARPFFILVVHSPLGAVRYVAAPKLSSWEAEPGAMEYVAAAELTLSGR